jgi:thioredoxin-like negative regulator of GroEL
MEWWVYVLAFIGALAVGLIAALLGRWLYFRQIRNSLVKLLGRREAMAAAGRGMQSVMEHLLGSDEEALTLFAEDPESDDRRALEDIAARMTLTADDLRALALPKRLWPVAEEMERAARAIGEQASRVREAGTPDAALDALGRIRMQEIRDEMTAVNGRLEPLLDAFRVDDPAVYGGGLYI